MAKLISQNQKDTKQQQQLLQQQQHQIKMKIISSTMATLFLASSIGCEARKLRGTNAAASTLDSNGDSLLALVEQGECPTSTNPSCEDVFFPVSCMVRELDSTSVSQCQFKSLCEATSAGFFVAECRPELASLEIPDADQAILDEAEELQQQILETANPDDEEEMEKLFQQYRVPAEERETLLEVIRNTQGTDEMESWTKEGNVVVKAGGGAVIVFDMFNNAGRRIIHGVGGAVAYAWGAKSTRGGTVHADSNYLNRNNESAFNINFAAFGFGALNINFFVNGSKIGYFTQCAWGYGAASGWGKATWYSRF